MHRLGFWCTGLGCCTVVERNWGLILALCGFGGDCGYVGWYSNLQVKQSAYYRGVLPPPQNTEKAKTNNKNKNTIITKFVIGTATATNFNFITNFKLINSRETGLIKPKRTTTQSPISDWGTSYCTRCNTRKMK